MELKENMTLKEISEIVGRHESSVRPKLENMYYFSNIKRFKENGTKFYSGVTEKNIEDLEKMHKFSRVR